MKPIIMLVMVVWSFSLYAQSELRLILANQSMSHSEFTFDLLAQVPESSSEGIYLYESDLYFHLERPAGSELTAEIAEAGQNENLTQYPEQIDLSLTSAFADHMSLHISEDHLMINLTGEAFQSAQELEENGMKIEASEGMYLLGSFVISGLEPTDHIQLRWDDERPQALMSQVYEIDPTDLMAYPVDFDHLILMEANFNNDEKVFAEAENSPYQNQNLDERAIDNRSQPANKIQWTSFPNPTSDKVTVEIPNLEGQTELWIVDGRGQKLGTISLTSQREHINMGDYTDQTGYYSLILLREHQKMETKTVYYQPY